MGESKGMWTHSTIVCPPKVLLEDLLQLGILALIQQAEGHVPVAMSEGRASGCPMCANDLPASAARRQGHLLPTNQLDELRCEL